MQKVSEKVNREYAKKSKIIQHPYTHHHTHTKAVKSISQ